MEILIGMFLLLLMLSVLVMVFQTGANAWAKADAETELLQTLQVLMARLERDAERSSMNSVTVIPDTAVSFLSPKETDDALALDPTLPPIALNTATRRPRWRAYIIYYYDSSLKAVLRREVPLLAGSPEETTPGPIESYDTNQPLSTYLTDGAYAGWQITRFEPTVPVGTDLLEVTAEASRERYGRQDPETSQLSTTIYLRN